MMRSFERENLVESTLKVFGRQVNKGKEIRNDLAAKTTSLSVIKTLQLFMHFYSTHHEIFVRSVHWLRNTSTFIFF